MVVEGEKEPNSHLIVVLSSLLDAARDKEVYVREAVCNALQSLLKLHIPEVVSSICQYRQRNHKLSTSHLSVLLSALERVAQERTLDKNVVDDLVQFSVTELTRTDTQPQIQTSAVNILICLGTNYCNQVLGAVMPGLVNGQEPQPWLLNTLGRLAATNPSDFLPVLKVALDILIPMMPSTRADATRIAFSFAMGRFCEAIIEYLSAEEEQRDKAVNRSTYAEDISKAYDVIANSWVQAKETKVAESGIRCIGSLFSLLPPDKAMASTSRAVTCLLSAYKRPCIPHHAITQTLASVLAMAPPAALQPLLDSVLHSLGNMVVIPPDYTLPHTVKQHSEVLRCYDHIGRNYSERLGDLMVKHLRMGGEKEKTEALVVCAHLLSPGESILKPRINEITSALRGVLQDPSVKVKKALVKAIVSLACRGYADDGPDLIEFLVRHSSSTHMGAEFSELSKMCGSTVHLFSSTVESLRPLLWTTLLKLLTDPSYEPVVPTITKALTQIAPFVPTTQEGPSRESVLSRCFALLGSPLNDNRGPSVLCFLQHYSPFVSPHITDLWHHKLPQLINYLHVSEWSENEWDSLLLELVQITVSTVACHEAEFGVGLAAALGCQLAAAQDGAGLVLCAIAVATAVLEDKNLVSAHLDTILVNLKSNVIDTKACARAVGILSTAHLDLVLSRLEGIAQSELNRRNSRLLGLMKDSRADAEMEKCREALLECYAAIAQRCPLMELLPKLDPLSEWLQTQIIAAKEISGREAAMEAVLQCADSLVRDKTEARHTLKFRLKLLSTVIEQITKNKPTPTSIKLTTALVKLPPPLVQDARLHVLKTCFDNVLAGPPNSSILKHLGELVEELLMESSTPDRLDEIATLLEPFLKQANSQQRLSAITILQTALLAYYHHMNPAFQCPSSFNQSGDLVGMLVVRCFDSSAEVSRISRHCAGLVLAIAGLYEGLSHDSSTENIFAEQPDESSLSSWNMTKILCSRLGHPQLHKLTGRLLDGLTDQDVTARCNASEALAAVFSLKGGELFHYVNDILGSLLLQLTSSLSPPSNGVTAVVALAKHHPKLVINNLLKQPLPLHPSVCETWRMLATDEGLSRFAIEHLLQVIDASPLFDDQTNARSKIAALQPLASVSGLTELVASGSVRGLVKNNLPQLVATLLALTAAYIGTSPPVVTPSPSKSSVITNRDAYRILPPKVVKECLERVLTGVGCDSGAEALIVVPQLQHIDSLLSALPQFTLNLCQCFPQMLPKLLAVLSQYATSECEPQRIAVTAFYSECLSVESKMGDASLVDNLISNLLTSVVDPDHTVRSIALKGLSYTAQLPPSQRDKHEEGVLSALMQGLDDSEGLVHTRIPLEAMRSLSSLLPSLPQKTLSRIQNPVAIRIKPFFEKEEIGLRSVSLELFGKLAPEDPSSGCSGYKEQVRSCLTCLILHLSEPEPSIVKACKYSLKQIAPLLGANKVAGMLQDHLIDSANLQYEQFITDLAKIIVEEMEDVAVNMITNCLGYTKSNWPNIRGNAALLIGLIYKYVESETRLGIGLDPVSCRLLQLISDENRDVRAKSIQSLATLFTP